jgi:hypothetical protein
MTVDVGLGAGLVVVVVGLGAGLVVVVVGLGVAVGFTAGWMNSIVQPCAVVPALIVALIDAYLPATLLGSVGFSVL